jgi:hypothetical protein
VTVSGCIELSNVPEVDLSQEEFDSLTTLKPRTIVSSSAGPCVNGSDLNAVTAKVNQPSSCKKATSSTNVEEPAPGTYGTYNLILSMSASSADCKSSTKTWPIIVGVICGVVVLAAIIIAVLFTTAPSLRLKVRPYAQRSTMR